MLQARAEITIMGKVVDVNFRSNSKKFANQLELSGWVQNEEPNKVIIIVEGEKEKIEKLIEWCKTGPEQAIVENIKVNWQEPRGKFGEFGIKY